MYKVITQNPIAYDSLDHTHPHGTANDNSSWPAFNKKLYDLFKNKISVLDLGCSGGKFVKDCLEDGHQAIGIEGSDYSKNIKRAEWATIPNNLFTADITKPFQVTFNDQNVRFDVITAWEVLEHIPEERMAGFLTNCLNHLSKHGIMVFSVSLNEDYWHVCIKEKNWWIRTFKRFGLTNVEDFVKYFGDDWVRGPLQGAPNSFHVVLMRN